MNGVLFGRILAAQRLRVAAVCVALFVWGYLLVVVYATFGKDFEALLRASQFSNLLDIAARLSGGNVFSLAGSVAFGLEHPIALALVGVFAVGFASSAVAGERQRGTLEVLLSRPIGRRALYGTFLVATVIFVALAETAVVLGAFASAVVHGLVGDLGLAGLAIAWANAVLLGSAIGAIGLAASTSTDRSAPAIGLTLAVALVSYAAEFLALLWPDARDIGPWSLFHYFRPSRILDGHADAADFLVLGVVLVAAVGYALVVFPKRDIAAPS